MALVNKQKRTTTTAKMAVKIHDYGMCRHERIFVKRYICIAFPVVISVVKLRKMPLRYIFFFSLKKWKNVNSQRIINFAVN